MSIAGNIDFIKEKLSKNTKLIAITKTRSLLEVMECYNSGHKVLGENKVQELVEKYESLPKDIEWHMVGHLQTNKVKFIVPFIHLIHGVDSMKLLNEIDKEGKKTGKIVSCLLQIYIASEETKFGMDEKEVLEVLQSERFRQLKNISIKGVMGMATNTENRDQIRKEFNALKKLSDHLQSSYSSTQHPFTEISMGMSNDYEIAIEEGSTMIRVGSSIFGERVYN